MVGQFAKLRSEPFEEGVAAELDNVNGDAFLCLLCNHIAINCDFMFLMSFNYEGYSSGFWRNQRRLRIGRGSNRTRLDGEGREKQSLVKLHNSRLFVGLLCDYYNLIANFIRSLSILQ